MQQEQKTKPETVFTDVDPFASIDPFAPSSTPASKSQTSPQPKDNNKQTTSYNFVTKNNIDFYFNGKKVDRSIILKNLRKKLTISVNNQIVKLTEDGDDFEFAPELNKKGLKSGSFTVNSINTNVKPHNFTTKDDINFFYKDKLCFRDTIVKNLTKGLFITVNNKSVQLTTSGKDFEYVQTIVNTKTDASIHPTLTTKKDIEKRKKAELGINLKDQVVIPSKSGLIISIVALLCALASLFVGIILLLKA